MPIMEKAKELRMRVEEQVLNKVISILAFIVGAIILFFGVMFILFTPQLDSMMIGMAILFVLAGLFDIWFGYDRMKWKKVELQVAT